MFDYRNITNQKNDEVILKCNTIQIQLQEQVEVLQQENMEDKQRVCSSNSGTK